MLADGIGRNGMTVGAGHIADLHKRVDEAHADAERAAAAL
jgi:hypothetical protein